MRPLLWDWKPEQEGQWQLFRIFWFRSWGFCSPRTQGGCQGMGGWYLSETARLCGHWNLARKVSGAWATLLSCEKRLEGGSHQQVCVPRASGIKTPVRRRGALIKVWVSPPCPLISFISRWPFKLRTKRREDGWRWTMHSCHSQSQSYSREGQDGPSCVSMFMTTVLPAARRFWLTAWGGATGSFYFLNHPTEENRKCVTHHFKV